MSARRSVELRLTYYQSSCLEALLTTWIDKSRPSKLRASIALTRDHLRAAHKEAAKL